MIKFREPCILILDFPLLSPTVRRVPKIRFLCLYAYNILGNCFFSTPDVNNLRKQSVTENSFSNIFLVEIGLRLQSGIGKSGKCVESSTLRNSGNMPLQSARGRPRRNRNMALSKAGRTRDVT